VIYSKKRIGWRTLLIVPELHHESSVFESIEHVRLRQHALNLEFIRNEVFRSLDSEATVEPDYSALDAKLKKTTSRMDGLFNPNFGSLFRCGNKTSRFAQQVGGGVCVCGGACARGSPLW
jgi:5'-nucleotidase